MANTFTDPAVLREQAATLYSLYESHSRSFKRTFVVLAAFMTVVFLLIFWPYVTFRGELYRLEAQQMALQGTIGATSREAEELAEEMSFFESAHRELHGFVEEVFREFGDKRRQHRQQLGSAMEWLSNEPGAAAWLAGEADAPVLSNEIIEQHPILVEYGRESCFWLRDEPWDRCWARQALNSLSDEAGKHYQSRRDSHLRNELRAPLWATLTGATERFASWLAGEQTGWRADGRPAAGDILTEFSDFAGEFLRHPALHFSELTEEHHHISRRISQLQAQASAAQEEMERTRTRIDEITALQDIDTPFGPLPVGINDLVLLFPILLSAGFLLCASQWCETLKVRRAFHELRRRQDPEWFTDRYIVLIAPLLVDPLQGRKQRVLGMIGLFSPALVFLAAVALLVVNRLLWGDFMEQVRLGAWVYIAGYVLSVALLVEGGRRIASALSENPIDELR